MRTLAAIALSALLGANCSSASADTGTGGGDTSAANYARVAQFAQCMRDNGVSNFPDPTESGPLQHAAG